MDWLAYQFRNDGTLDHWQALVAGMVAIVAALIGGCFINRQINAANAIETDRLKRKFDAARAILPLTLSSISEYSRRCNEYLKAILDTRISETIPKQQDPATSPDFPVSVIENLRALIEYSDEPLRGALARLMAELQVQSSRLTSLSAELHAGHRDELLVVAANIETYILDAAEIYARCAALFDFARRNTDAVPGGPTVADMHSALTQTGFWFDDFERLHATVERRYGRR